MAGPREFAFLGSFAKGLADRLQENRKLAELVAEREIRRQQEEADRAERETRFQTGQFNLRQQRTREEERFQIGQQEKETANILSLAREKREQEPIPLISTVTGETIADVDPRAKFAPLPRVIPQPKVTPRQKVLQKAGETILTKGVTSQNKEVANSILQSLGIDIAFEDAPRGFKNLFGLRDRGTQPVSTAPIQVREKSTKLIGTIPENEFDPNLHERL